MARQPLRQFEIHFKPKSSQVKLSQALDEIQETLSISKRPICLPVLILIVFQIICGDGFVAT